MDVTLHSTVSASLQGQDVGTTRPFMICLARSALRGISSQLGDGGYGRVRAEMLA